MFAAEFKHVETIKRDQPDHTAFVRCKQQTYFRKNDSCRRTGYVYLE